MDLFVFCNDLFFSRVFCSKLTQNIENYFENDKKTNRKTNITSSALARKLL